MPWIPTNGSCLKKNNRPLISPAQSGFFVATKQVSVISRNCQVPRTVFPSFMGFYMGETCVLMQFKSLLYLVCLRKTLLRFVTAYLLLLIKGHHQINPILKRMHYIIYAVPLVLPLPQRGSIFPQNSYCIEKVIQM